MFQKHTYSLSSIKVQPSDFCLYFSCGKKIQLQPKLIEVLGYLANQYPRVVPREEIIAAVWGENSFVGEKALTNAIWNLRQKLTLEDQQEVIETIRKSGYRLLVAPQLLNSTNELSNNASCQAEISNPTIKNKNNAYWLRASLYGLASFLMVYIIWQQLTIDTSINAPMFEQITTEPGNELFTSPSPDGRYIVYQWHDPQGISNLYMRDRTQPQLKATQLTYDSAEQGFSVWSLNGEYLYFAKKDKINKRCDLIQMQVKTNEETIIGQCHNRGGYYYIDISADGKTLAYHGKNASDSHSGIYFLDLTSPELNTHRFSCNLNCNYRDRDMSFSPDGRYIAVSRRYSTFEENIYLINLVTKEEKQLTFSEEDIVGLTWHPNGKHIVFATQRADIRQGYMVEPESGIITNLNVEGFSYPKYSSQSAELFFQHRLEHYQVSSLSVKSDITASPFPVLQSKFNHLSADYSVSQDKITYVSNESGFYELWSANSDGSHRQQLTFIEDTVKYPKWSNDGSKIAFLSANRSGKGDQIYILDFNSKKLRQLSTEFKRHNRPTWSFDDNYIISAVYAEEYTDLHQFDLKSETSKRVTFDGARTGVINKENQLYYSRVSGGLWQTDLNSDKLSVKQLLDKDIFNTVYSWEITERGIYFNHHTTSTSKLKFYDFSNNHISTFLTQPKNAVASSTNLTIIDDLQLLLFTGSSFPQADIKKLQHPKLR
ncbi:winged helix-turn-helix domain-containing protein [Thalassotalea nanhaiensis]|uniref:Winged helix-turn-helix domain-containing protein n=1 Tax=Thalassotalea nanhaiensis TaxID=3065648 RepID=A0ABY9TN44_9GAMM|nr:winged helix-turn-helix domain-containing protein [Colwelliaceae bacterium SQ345]